MFELHYLGIGDSTCHVDSSSRIGTYASREECYEQVSESEWENLDCEETYVIKWPDGKEETLCYPVSNEPVWRYWYE